MRRADPPRTQYLSRDGLSLAFQVRWRLEPEAGGVAELPAPQAEL
jgi:hypothetical protein